jgi:hypothetical protein
MFIKLTVNSDISYWESEMELHKTIPEKCYFDISKAYQLFPCGTATIIHFPGDRVIVQETPEEILKLLEGDK